MNAAAAQVPLWVALALAFGSPILAFGGVLLGQLVSRRTAQESEVRWRREETLRMLRWSAELATDPDAVRSDVGVAALGALGDSALLQEPDQRLVRSVLATLLSDPAEDYPGSQEGP